MTTAWEDICRQCGQCCFEKIIDGQGRPYTTDIACRFLDVVTRRCKVYHKRFEVGEGCINLTPEVVRDADWLPEDCAYVEYIRRPKDEDD
jgi:uncharacterized cysteine cluster protein YcgN (CxxCxxCC family)